MQDSFLKLWERWDQIDRIADPTAYLYRVALNGFRMRRRRAATAARKLFRIAEERDAFSVHFWAHLLGGIGMGAFMGVAGLQGMLRRTIYSEREYRPYMILAAVSGLLLLVAFVAFLANIVMTAGLKGAVGIFRPSRLDPQVLMRSQPTVPAALEVQTAGSDELTGAAAAGVPELLHHDVQGEQADDGRHAQQSDEEDALEDADMFGEYARKHEPILSTGLRGRLG
jgi:hypothetical protein